MTSTRTLRRASRPTPPYAHPKLASDEDLVATLVADRVGSASRKRAEDLLSQVGGLSGLARLGDAIPRFDGIAPAAAHRLAVAVEIGLRCAEPSLKPVPVVSCSDDVVAVIGPRLRYLQHEQVWMVGLDARNGVTSRCRVAEGGQHGCALLVRDVLRVAVQFGAHCFVLVHNHPGGDPRPSAEDVHLTEKISAAALCVGIPLLDHVIITRRGHSSLLKLGLIPEMGEEVLTDTSRPARVAGAGNRFCSDR
jgi:DNA repair protein RadC